jgi:hypothetical protein
LYSKTSNPYSFKYLETGLTGDGIKQVYLPPTPDKDKIHDLGGGWERQQFPKHYGLWLEELAETGRYNPNFQAYEDQQWYYRNNGFWFWNTVKGKKTPTYITNTHWFQLQWMKCKARTPTGYLDFRDPVKEILYLWEFVRKNPQLYGLILCGPRRMSKSTIMGAVGLEDTIKTPLAVCGIQGEKDEKSQTFYEDNILYPFKRLPEFFVPVYDTSTRLKEGIFFTESITRGKAQRTTIGKTEALEGSIEYGPTKDINHFNSRMLTTYLLEEGGKIRAADVRKLWGAVKDTHRLGDEIIGKTLCATTADAAEDAKNDEGITPEFLELVYQSDYDIRLASGETKSGLMAALIPAQYVLTYDKYGIPDSEHNYKTIMNKRPDVREEPLLYSQAARKNPTTWEEYFYANADKCLFSVMILQNRKSILAKMPHLCERYNLAWKDGVRFSKVIMIPSKTGKFHFTDVPEDRFLNLVKDTNASGYYRYEPQNTTMFHIGHDPVMFRKPKSGRFSSPVAYGFRVYDPLIDGELNDERAKYNAEIEYEYKTGFPWVMYDYRPDEPQEYFEYMIMLCWLLGCKMSIERQHGSALMEYLKIHGCGEFILLKDSKSMTLDESDNKVEGFHATTESTMHFSSLISTFVKYFGHRIMFSKLVDQLLVFDTSHTLEYDHVVACGWGLVGLGQQKKQKPPALNIEQLFTTFNTSGNTATYNT